MTLEQLRIFLVVAEHEHVTRASHALDLAQSAVSRSIAMLEGEIELRLFERVGRNIKLTPLGARFAARARGLLDEAKLLESWIADARGDAAGRCCIRVDGKPSDDAAAVRALEND